MNTSTFDRPKIVLMETVAGAPSWLAHFAVIVTAICGIFGSGRAHAEDDPTRTVLAAALHSRQALFSGIESYKVSGTIKSVHSDAMMAGVDAASRTALKQQEIKFRTLAQGYAMRVDYEHLGPAKRLLPALSFFADFDNAVTVQTLGRRVASMSSLGFSKGDSGLGDYAMAFIEYGFLTAKASSSGLPALPPSAFQEKERWERFLKNVSSCSVDSDGRLHVTANFDGEKRVVDFGTVKGSELVPLKLQCFDAAGGPLRTIEIMEFESDKAIGARPHKLKLEAYAELDKDLQKKPIATCEVEIEEFIVNPALDEGDVKFDPASVDKIWDGEKNIWIEVPK